MRVIDSALAVLVLAAVSAAATGVSHLPTSHVRSLGTTALRKAHSKARALHQFRKMQDGGHMGDMGDMNDMMDGLEELFGDDGDMMDSMMGLVCMMMPMVTSDPTFAEEMEKQGMVCPEFGCNEEATHLIMKCSIDGPVCQDAPNANIAGVESDEEFCVVDTEVDMSMELDFQEESEIKSSQCMTYTEPEYMAKLGRGCFDVKVNINYGALMDAAMGGDVDPDMTEEEAVMMANEYVKIEECSGTFEGGVECTCGTCNGGMGFELKCNNEIVTEECTSFDASSVDGVTQMTEGGAAGGPAVSVIRFAKASDDTSPAANKRAEAVAAGLVLAIASFFAAM